MGEWIEYQARLQTQEIERARPTDLRVRVYAAGSLVAPTEAGSTVSVYNDSNEAVIDAQGVTVTSSIATYEVQAADVADESFGAGWRVEWSLLMPDEFVHPFREEASLVRCKLHPAVTDADLLERHPELSNYIPTGQTSWQPQVLAAWRDVNDRLEEDARRPALIMSSSALRMVTLFHTLEIVCGLLAAAGAADNRWHVEEEKYRTRYESAWGRLTFDYDEDDTGEADSTSRKGPTRHVWLAGR